ncbi:MAG: type II toxin-antitoxin system Phd/YefM family antitoxin [Geminicoccaceae bacterium]
MTARLVAIDRAMLTDYSHDHGQESVMRTVKASEFKATCLKLMDEVAASGEPVVITKNGKPVAQLGPVGRERKSIWGLHKGQIEILGDIIEPIDVEWEANR